MSEIIVTEKGTYNISTTEGQWKYLCEFLAGKGASGGLWTCLNKLYESAAKPDPRDELIRVYESALYAIGDGEVAGFDIYWAAEQAEEALAQGQEIKKRIN